MTSPAQTPAAANAPTRGRTSQRDLVIDVVRGIAIALVAFGHTDLGILFRGWWGTSNTGLRMIYAIYAFHMPAFFFVSGVFLRRSVAKRGEKGYVLEKLRTIIYPYVLWAIILAAATVPFGRFMLQQTPSWRTFFYGLVTGNSAWFLPTLFFSLMLGMLFRNFPMPLLFVLAAAACIWFPHTTIDFEDRPIRHFVFLVAGMWAGGSLRRIQQIPSSVAALAAAVFAVLIVWVTGKPYGASGYLFIPLGLLGTLMLILIAKCLGQSTAARALAWTGEASFGIFLLSPFGQGTGREFILRLLHTTAPWPQLIFPTVVAVIVPAWLYHRRKPLHIQWMFIWPF